MDVIPIILNNINFICNDTWIDQTRTFSVRKVSFDCLKCGTEVIKNFRSIKRTEFKQLCFNCIQSNQLNLRFQSLIESLKEYVEYFGSEFIEIKKEQRRNIKSTAGLFSNKLYGKCKCGILFSAFIEQYSYGTQIPKCRKCSLNFKGNRTRLILNYNKKSAFTDDEIKEYFGRFDAIPLEPFISLKTLLKTRCKCGKEFYYSFSHARANKLLTPPYCLECKYLRKNITLSYKRSRIHEGFDVRWYFWILEKFDFKCCISGVSRELSGHHIFPYSKYPKLRESKNNGVCINKSLHKEYHILYKLNEIGLDSFSEFFKLKTGKVFSEVFPISVENLLKEINFKYKIPLSESYID